MLTSNVPVTNLSDWDEKMQLAGQVGAIRDRMAAPLLLNWAVAATLATSSAVSLLLGKIASTTPDA